MDLEGLGQRRSEMARCVRCVFRTVFVMAALLHLSSGAVDVVLEVPGIPVQEGETITIKCTVTEKSPYKVFIMRQGMDQNGQFLVVSDRAVAILPNNIIIDVSEDILNNIFVATLTLTVNRTDAQTYTCWTGSSSNDNDIIASDSSDLIVNYLPNARYPICEIIGPNTELIRPAGSDIILDCVSEIGNPPAELQWIRESGSRTDRLPSIDSTSGTFTTSRIVVTLENNHDGASLTCSLSRSPERRCSIGPIQISGSIPAPGGGSETSYNPGMVVALAILAAVVVIVAIVIVIAVLVKCGHCTCNNCNNRLQNGDAADSRGMEMKTRRPKRAEKVDKKTNNNKQDLQYEIANVPITEYYPTYEESNSENEYAYTQDIQEEPSIGNGSAKAKDYPAPPSYPPSETVDDTVSEKPDDIEVVMEMMDDDIVVSSDKQAEDMSVPSTDLPPPEVEEMEQPVESDPIDVEVTTE